MFSVCQSRLTTSKCWRGWRWIFRLHRYRYLGRVRKSDILCGYRSDPDIRQPRKKGLHFSGSVMCKHAGEDISHPSALSCGYGFVVNGPELVFSTMGYAKQSEGSVLQLGF